MNGIALALGPVIGGVLVEYVDWRAVFWTNVPLVIVAFLLVSRYVPAVPPRAERGRFDLAGLLTITAALVSLITALIQGPTWGWGAPATLALFAAAAVLLAYFITVEARVAAPMLPLKLFTTRTFCAANLSAAVLMLGIMSCFFFLSLFLQDVLGYSGVQTGLAYVPMAVFMAGLAPLAGSIASTFGPRLPIIAGLLSSALGVLWISRIDTHAGYQNLVGGLMLVGLGMGLASPQISNAAVSSAPAALAGAASGMNSMARQVGGAIGIALLTAIFSGRFTSHLAQDLAESGLPATEQRRVLASAGDITGSTGQSTSTPEAGMIHSVFHAAFAQGMADTLTVFAALAGAGMLVALLIRRGDFARARAAGADAARPAQGAAVPSGAVPAMGGRR
jgi:MFS family permease